MSAESLDQVIEKVEEIANYLKVHCSDPFIVKTAADDLLSLCRYRSNVLGKQYEEPDT